MRILILASRTAQNRAAGFNIRTRFGFCILQNPNLLFKFKLNSGVVVWYSGLTKIRTRQRSRRQYK
ncbi:hypothetical protein CWI52_03040 [Neisseria meningitidis]|nr:hypothetical protein CWI52_03040 [Neisseria meningitidis]